ncbi:MAG: hypothetical protein JWO19_3242 [Bryobacterales bacterium]|nr:hypothetical protein [Bryobacterales bacterium]
MGAKVFVLAASLGVLATIPMMAHHSFASEYDDKKPLKFENVVVTKVEWTNPHARFYVDVKDAKGNVTNWNFELASPNVLKRNGWSKSTLKEGDRITVQGSAAKDGALLGHATTVVLPDGKRVFAGSNTADGQ